MSLTEFSNAIDFGDFSPNNIDDALSVTKSIVDLLISTQGEAVHH